MFRLAANAQTHVGLFDSHAFVISHGRRADAHFVSIHILQHRDRPLERHLGFGEQREATRRRLQHELLFRPDHFHRLARECEIESIFAVGTLALNWKTRIHRSLLLLRIAGASRRPFRNPGFRAYARESRASERKMTIEDRPFESVAWAFRTVLFRSGRLLSVTSAM